MDDQERGTVHSHSPRAQGHLPWTPQSGSWSFPQSDIQSPYSAVMKSYAARLLMSEGLGSAEALQLLPVPESSPALSVDRKVSPRVGRHP